MNEIWKEIPLYNNYKVSNLGNVYSKRRNKVLKGGISNGYRHVDLYSNNKRKMFKVHQLVAIAFLKHRLDNNMVVNHKDFNRLNNNVSNLEVITQRQNANKKHLKSSSKYTGVHWCKRAKKWASVITTKNKKKHLGYFIDEFDAHIAYETKLQTIL